ncbi:MAG: alpha/beta hydrolase [candidate division WOR-3 bacterium]|nr:MAG: alpha/beta hydrolase [candidate division WOR-3 bacterium]
MDEFRTYGTVPYLVAVVHGGPGAPGEMAPVARELAYTTGVIEPLQTGDTVEKQVEELRAILTENAELPVTLIGYSWGAWLSFIVASRYPSMIGKLILVSSGPFEEEYSRDIMKKRLSRLDESEKQEALSLIESFNVPIRGNMDEKMARFGQLISKADSYDPLPHDDEVLEMQYRIFQSVWKDAEQLRHSGELLRFGTNIQCPVVAIHGAYDPHPAEGVEKPLSGILKDFRFFLLQNCGHTPWIERQARDGFYEVLMRECR